MRRLKVIFNSIWNVNRVCLRVLCQISTVQTLTADLVRFRSMISACSCHCTSLVHLSQSVLRMSQSLPSSPLSEPYHPILTPTQTLSPFSLDQTIFSLQGDSRWDIVISLFVCLFVYPCVLGSAVQHACSWWSLSSSRKFQRTPWMAHRFGQLPGLPGRCQMAQPGNVELYSCLARKWTAAPVI